MGGALRAHSDSCKSTRDFWQMYDPGTHEPETVGLIANMIYVAMVVVGYGIAAVFSPQTGRFLRIECLRYRNSNRWKQRERSQRCAASSTSVCASTSKHQRVYVFTLCTMCKRTANRLCTHGHAQPRCGVCMRGGKQIRCDHKNARSNHHCRCQVA